MKVNKTILLTAFLVGGCLLKAQEQPFNLTLEQAIQYALEHNKMILNARDQVKSSREMLKGTIAQGLPQIEGSLDYMTYFNYEMEFNITSGEQPNIDYSLLDAGDVQVLSALEQMFSSDPIILDDQMSGKVQVSQLIFSKQYLTGIQIAKIARKLYIKNLESSELDIKEGITNTYYAILTNEHSLKIFEEQMRNLDVSLQHTRNMYKVGMMEETDVDQISITVSQLKNSQKMLERMLQLSYNMLKFQMGVSPDAKIELSDSLEQVIGLIDPQSALQPDFDVTENINYQLVESNVMLSKKQLDLQIGAYMPTVVGFYSYTEKFITTAFDMTPNHLAGVSVSVPIFSSGMRRSKVAQANIDLDIARRNQDLIKDQLETQKKQLLFNYQSALEDFNTQKESVVIAGRVYKSIQNKYQQGLSSSLDLTQANSNYLTAESNYLSSVLTLLQAQTSLAKLYNTL